MTTFTCRADLEDKSLKTDDFIYFFIGEEKAIKYAINCRYNDYVYLQITNPLEFGEGIANDLVFKRLGILDIYPFTSSIVGYKIENGCFPELKNLDDLKKVVLVLYTLIEKINKKGVVLSNIISINDLRCKLKDKIAIDKKYIYVFHLLYFRDEFKGQLLLLLNKLKIPYTLESIEKEDLKISVELTDELIIELNILLKKITLY